MDKSDLSGQLENAKNSYILGLAAISLFGVEESHSILEKNHASFGQYTVKFDQVANLLRDESDRGIAVKEFLKMLLRALIKESFELIQGYCEDTGQSALFKSEPWYQFARMIRNCLSHNFRFMFNNYDKSLLPVTWRTRTITLSMDGQSLSLHFFGYLQTWELFQDFQDFSENRLS